MTHNTTTTPTKVHKDAKLGVIPDGWKLLEFDEFAVRSKETYSNKKDKNNYKCIELEHINQNTGSINGWVNSVDQKSTKSKFLAGQILFGKLRPYLRKFWKADFSGVCSMEIWVLDGKESISLNEFLFYLIQSNRFIQAANATTGSKMPRADWWYVSKVPFFLPTIQEQQKIAQILTTWDVAINKQEVLIAQKQEQKKALMQQLLTGKKRFAGFEDEWEEVRLKNILEYEQPTKYIVEDDSYSDSNKTPVLTANKSFVLGYTNETEGIYKALPIILFDDFTTDNKWVDFPFKVKSSAIKILKLKNKEFDLRFVFERMQILHFNKIDHKRYYISEYQYLKFDCPNLKEQQKIAEVLTAADNEIKALQQQLQKLKTQKQGLMQQLLTGKIRVNKN